MTSKAEFEVSAKYGSLVLFTSSETPYKALFCFKIIIYCVWGTE